MDTRICQNCRNKTTKGKCSKLDVFVPRKKKINGEIPAKECKWFYLRKDLTAKVNLSDLRF